MFKLTDKQWKKVKKWVKQQDEIASKMHKNPDGPNYGAIGGGITYSFTPTRLGVIEKVSNSITGNDLDLTEYNLW